MNIERLQLAGLDETRRLAAELFPWEAEHQAALPASLFPEAHHHFFEEARLNCLKFFVGHWDGRISGVAGLYNYRTSPAEGWLMWYGLRPAARGRGFGSKILDRIIAEARVDGRRVLRLWTTLEDEYLEARRLYAKRGFNEEICPALPGEDWTTVVMSMSLDGTPIPSWNATASHGDLWGRVVPETAKVA